MKNNIYGCQGPICCSLVVQRGDEHEMRSMPLAMAYVPWQKWDKLYAEDVALAAGTAFPALDLPFLGNEVLR